MFGLLPKSRAICRPSSAPHFFFTGSSGSSIAFLRLLSERHEVKVTLGSQTLKETKALGGELRDCGLFCKRNVCIFSGPEKP